jgi:hypothetical protein
MQPCSCCHLNLCLTAAPLVRPAAALPTKRAPACSPQPGHRAAGVQRLPGAAVLPAGRAERAVLPVPHHHTGKHGRSARRRPRVHPCDAETCSCRTIPSCCTPSPRPFLPPPLPPTPTPTPQTHTRTHTQCTICASTSTVPLLLPHPTPHKNKHILSQPNPARARRCLCTATSAAAAAPPHSCSPAARSRSSARCATTSRPLRRRGPGPAQRSSSSSLPRPASLSPPHRPWWWRTRPRWTTGATRWAAAALAHSRGARCRPCTHAAALLC